MLTSGPAAAFAERLVRRCEEWAEQMPAAGCSRDEGRSRLGAGRTWIDAGLLDPAPALAESVLRGLLDELRPETGPQPHVLRRLDEALAAGRLQAPLLLRSMLGRDGVALDERARHAGVPTQVIEFLGAYLARPFLKAASREFDPALVDPERSGSLCPVCGREAALGFFEPDTGRRQLWCRTCGNRWPVLRLRCPFCSNADAGSLGYFELEGMPGRRVDFCRRCMRYLKTMDLRDAAAGENPSQADLMDLTTTELDDAAAQEGFSRLLPAGGPAVPDSKE